ncbi:septal ring lytic transglycosylase RlpA family protein [Pseudomonadota bacterium]
MRKTNLIKNICVFAAAAFVLGACAETKLFVHASKRLNDTNGSQGTYKVGKPYQIDGKWYYPSENWNYDKSGVASWYGPNFHGKPTANGETFDQWEVSAAHKTLPLPSIVRVTNLSNGRSLVVRINDRGPFAHSRIIDMSRRAAQLLGFEKEGTANVRVQVMAKESQALAQRLKGGGPSLSAANSPIQTNAATAAQSTPVTSETLPAPDYATTSPVQTQAVQVARIEPIAPPPASTTVSSGPLGPVGTVYVQAGAFSNEANAERVRMTLASFGHKVSVTPVLVNGRDLFRVRVGPVASDADAQGLLIQVVDAGYANARTVSDPYGAR